MVVDYKKMKMGRIYRIYRDLEEGYSVYMTRFKDKHLISKKPMVALYTLSKEGKIERYFVGYLDKREWGEPNISVDGWSIDKNTSSEDVLTHIGDPESIQSLYFRFSSLKDISPIEYDHLIGELLTFFSDPVEYFKSEKPT